jgi:hypothetical protein
MDASATTALATLLGAAIGGLTSVLATWLTHRTQARAQWLEQDALRRRDLYKGDARRDPRRLGCGCKTNEAREGEREGKA